MSINWKATKEDKKLINLIAKRADADAKNLIDKSEHLMNITGCHLNGNPLKLKELLEADNFNFTHDVFGIARHINKKDASLNNFFVPRFSA